MRVGRNRDRRGPRGVQREAHPLQQRNPGFAIAVDLEEGLGGALVADGMKDDLGRKPEVNGGGIRPGLGGNLVPHLGAGIRASGGPRRGQHDGKMAGFVEEIAWVKETLGVNDQAARLQRDAGKEGVSAQVAPGEP